MFLTLDKLATVGLARVDLESDDVPLRDAGQPLLPTMSRVKDGGGGRGTRTCASLRSLMGIPIVEVMSAGSQSTRLLGNKWVVES